MELIYSPLWELRGGYDRMTHMKLWYNLLYDLRVVTAAPCGVALFFLRSLILGPGRTGGTGWD